MCVQYIEDANTNLQIDGYQFCSIPPGGGVWTEYWGCGAGNWVGWNAIQKYVNSKALIFSSPTARIAEGLSHLSDVCVSKFLALWLVKADLR